MKFHVQPQTTSDRNSVCLTSVLYQYLEVESPLVSFSGPVCPSVQSMYVLWCGLYQAANHILAERKQEGTCCICLTNEKPGLEEEAP